MGVTGRGFSGCGFALHGLAVPIIAMLGGFNSGEHFGCIQGAGVGGALTSGHSRYRQWPATLLSLMTGLASLYR